MAALVTIFYEHGVLTFIRDEASRLLVHNFYDHQRLSGQQYGNGDTVQYQYVLSPNRYYAQQANVTLPGDVVKHVDLANYISDVYKRMR